MTRKVIFALIAIVVIAAGYTGFKKLNYWQRSIRIFSYNSNETYGHGRETSHRDFERPDRFMPDSLREKQGIRRPKRSDIINPDTLRHIGTFQGRRRGNSQTTYEGGNNDNYSRPQRGEFGREGTHNRKVINLTSVWWYLAVFASFTVITIYFDKIIIIRMKR